MSTTPCAGMTPKERLQASRAHIRAVLLEAQTPNDSLLSTLLKPIAAEHPLTLAAIAALLGGVFMTAKPWRYKAIATPLITWASVSLTTWLQNRPRKT